MRHGLPDLVAGEAQDGRKELCDGVQDQIQGRLSRTALKAVLLLAVQPVLDDVQIEAGQIHHAEIVDGVGHHMELIFVISRLAPLHQLVQTGDGPLVQGQHLLGRHQVVGIKARQISQAIPGGVAELQIVLAQLLEDVVRAAHIHMIIGRASPQTQ